MTVTSVALRMYWTAQWTDGIPS